MNPEKSAGFMVGALLVGVLAIGGLAVVALGGPYTETSVTNGDAQDMEPEVAIITEKSRSGGTSIFGLHLGHRTHRASVRFVAAPGCFELVDFGDRWPAPFEECSSPDAITGEISGGGIAATGRSIIEVEVEVSAEC